MPVVIFTLCIILSVKNFLSFPATDTFANSTRSTNPKVMLKKTIILTTEYSSVLLTAVTLPSQISHTAGLRILRKNPFNNIALVEGTYTSTSSVDLETGGFLKYKVPNMISNIPAIIPIKRWLFSSVIKLVAP